MTIESPQETPSEVTQFLALAEAVGASLDASQADMLLDYLDAVLKENKSINVTAIRNREAAISQHLLDSLSVVGLWHLRHGGEPPKTVLDLGTGGGFPAVPLAVAWPYCQVTAIDGTGKKIALVQRCLDVAGINNVEAIQCRGFDLPKQQPARRRSYQFAVARAVGNSKKLISELAPLVQPGGEIYLMKGAEPPDAEILEARKAMPQYGLELFEHHPLDVPKLPPRSVLIFRKLGKERQQS